MDRIHVIDSHTGGEPTRLVIEGGPNLGSGPLIERCEVFRRKFDRFRSAVVNEPRGSDVFVGGILVEPIDPRCTAGVIFFNNVGYLGMCGHGTIGLLVTLRHLGRVHHGVQMIETPVGVVTAELIDARRVRLENVPAYRYRAAVEIDVPGHGPVKGDVAWGGNWFFLISDHGLPITPAVTDRLTDFTRRVREALDRYGVKGVDGAAIDHVELFAPSTTPGVDSRNFVLCPGGAYDRSPCGTGTSAKMACLAADGRLSEGEVWRQESVIGSVFEGTYRRSEASEHHIVPSIVGSAHVMADAHLIIDPTDPLAFGIRGYERSDP